MSGRPTVTVTFVFTDVEGSTELLRRVGPERDGRRRRGDAAAARALAAVAETAPL